MPWHERESVSFYLTIARHVFHNRDTDDCEGFAPLFIAEAFLVAALILSLMKF
jgi:hypothetical protein